MLTLAHVAAPEYAWTHGLTLGEAADRAGSDPATFALDVLAASRLEVNVVMAVRNERSPAELASILAHPRALGGSDGIFVGAHPHPRARGSFARYLRSLVVEQGVLSWPDAAALVSTRAADRFALGRRGRIRPGWIADLVLVDPDAVRDRATYDAAARPRGGHRRRARRRGARAGGRRAHGRDARARHPSIARAAAGPRHCAASSPATASHPDPDHRGGLTCRRA